jgi:hypothetical protein
LVARRVVNGVLPRSRCHGLRPGIVGAAHRVGLQGVEGALPSPGRCARHEVTAPDPRSSIGILVSQRSRRLRRRALTSTRDDPVVAKPGLQQDRYQVQGLRVVGSGVSRHR